MVTTVIIFLVCMSEQTSPDLRVGLHLEMPFSYFGVQLLLDVCDVAQQLRMTTS